ncbi:COMM domain-containing protein 3 [Trichoplax sp. H2]|nr:COMM domain-containing protein 3 [Trichoplax sp. H2]|eukprot:RDD42602.1 COMM domain-containing protein 3 [Trichoplax sp. H2]
MEVSKKVLEGLETCSNSSYFSDRAFQDLCQITLGILLKENAESDLEKTTSLASISDKSILKQAYASLITFIVECARVDATSATVNTMLEDCKFTPERTSCFTSIYFQHKQQVRQILGGVSFRLPHIVNTEWRMDYVIKNNSLEKINAINYTINFKVEDQNESRKDVQFCCSVEELQDLVWKLKEAVKAVERFS